MKKLEISKETLRVLSHEDAEKLAGGMIVWAPTQKPVTLCVPTVCHYRDCQ